MLSEDEELDELIITEYILIIFGLFCIEQGGEGIKIFFQEESFHIIVRSNAGRRSSCLQHGGISARSEVGLHHEHARHEERRKNGRSLRGSNYPNTLL